MFAAGELSSKAAYEHGTTCLVEFERVRASLAAAEASAAAGWKPDKGVEMRSGTIFGTAVTAGRLAVVLDDSPSMTRYLPNLRKEIARDFPDAYFVEVDGCELTGPARCSWLFSAPARAVNPFTPDRHIPKIPTPGPTLQPWFYALKMDPVAPACMPTLGQGLTLAGSVQASHLAVRLSRLGVGISLP